MGKMCSCGGCHIFTKHYAKGLCKNCYNTMLRNGFTDTKQLSAYKKGRLEHKTETAKKKAVTAERINNLKITSCNEFNIAPRGEVSKRIFDWYYNETEKYLIFDCGDDNDLRVNVYNTAYGMTKRRHKLNIARYQRKGKIILERIAI